MIFSDPLVFVLCLITSAIILCILVYYLITLSDLECDYINAQQCCTKLNSWIGPQILAHSLVTFLLLIHGHWLLFLVNLPLSFWISYEIMSIPKGNMGVYDPTEIHNGGQLKRHMRKCMIYLGFYLLSFFLYLYCLLNAFLSIDPLQQGEADDHGMMEF